MENDRDFDDAVRYAQQHLDDERVIARTLNFIQNGWSSPDAAVQARQLDAAKAAVYKARNLGALDERPRTGKGEFF